MKYLFFDIECANCFDRKGKIFSFGYVLTDEKFNVLEPREDILVDPDAPFDWYVAKKMMAYDKKEFRTKPRFDRIYPRIKELSEGAVAAGYNVAADVVYLLDECDRYGLEPLKLDFFDVQQLEQKVSGEKNVCKLSLEYEKWCERPAHDTHRSDMDAEMTMDVAAAIAGKLGTDMDGLVALAPEYRGRTDGFFYGYAQDEKRDSRDKTPKPRFRKLKEGQLNFSLRGSKNAEIFARYARYVDGKAGGAPKICLSDNVEIFDFERSMKLLARAELAGLGYSYKPAGASVFVTSDSIDDKGKPRKCSKTNKAKNIAASGGELKLVDIASFESSYPLPDGLDTDWDRFLAPEYDRKDGEAKTGKRRGKRKRKDKDRG